MRKAKAVWHRDDDAVSPVIGTILMVAITVVLAAVLWLMVSGMISQGDDEKITVTLANPDTNRGIGNRSTVWDTTLNVQKMTPSDKKVLWTEARVIVKSASGSVLLSSTAVSADNASAYDDTSPFTVEVWYVETTTGDTKMSAGDAIKITGMSVAYEGATVEVLKGGERIAKANLGTQFP